MTEVFAWLALLILLVLIELATMGLTTIWFAAGALVATIAAACGAPVLRGCADCWPPACRNACR